MPDWMKVGPNDWYLYKKCRGPTEVGTGEKAMRCRGEDQSDAAAR